MNKQSELAIIRRAYAKQVLATAGVKEPRLESAYAQVSREYFLGPGPWPIFRWWSGTYTQSPDDDPVYLYTNDVIGIDPERRINNGEPAFHANLIAAALPRQGEHVVHIGTGVGYYTAILAHLVGSGGRVTGIEFESDLAARAKVNFSASPNVEIIQGDGTVIDFDTANVIYVNAGATQPARAWLDRLAEGGRLILPLTTEHGFTAARSSEQVARSGAVFRIERRGADYLAKSISAVAIFPCAGGRDPMAEAALSAAFAEGGLQNVTRLYRHNEIPAERCWLRAPDWCLAFS
jgi:protein-L-isoaspartate(D-aspartate) O-methyltransferase